MYNNNHYHCISNRAPNSAFTKSDATAAATHRIFPQTHKSGL